MLKLKSKLIVVVMVMFGITVFMSCEKENNNLNEDVSIDNAQIKKLAETHNLYLGEIVKSYDYTNDKNDINALKKSFLKADLADIGESVKLTILENLNKFTNKSTGESSFVPVSTENLFDEINSNNFSNKELIIEFLTVATNKVMDEQLTCSELTFFLDNIEGDAINNLEENEMIVLKSYFETLKASAYFWFSEELGGSGIGYTHIRKLNNNMKPMTPVGAALISDASSMSIGMIGVAVAGVFCGPIGWGALAIVAGESAVNSGLAGAIAAGMD